MSNFDSLFEHHLEEIFSLLAGIENDIYTNRNTQSLTQPNALVAIHTIRKLLNEVATEKTLMHSDE